MLKTCSKRSGATPVALLWFLLLGLLLPTCSPDNQTGVWIRIVSPLVTIANARLYVYDATSFDTQWVSQVDVPEPPLPEARTFDPTSDVPSNQLWVLILAGSEVSDSIRIVGVGLRDGHEVANANLDKIVFSPGKIVDHADEEGNPLTLVLEGCEDKDQDGFCPPSDCDDEDAAVNPDVAEVCDGKDNNCDRATDEGCPCSPGEQRDCWPQWAPALDTICLHIDDNDPCVCKQGTQSCAGGVWGACDGLVMPVAEGKLDENGNPVPCDDHGSFLCYPSCTDEVDNDCNRFVDLKDTGCGGCEPGTERDCYTGPSETRTKGTCHDGRQYCTNDGTWPLVCPGEATPMGWSKETPDGAAEFDNCDNLDNDCDNVTDNVTIHEHCERDKGCCHDAVKECIAGQWIACTYEDYRIFAHDYCYNPDYGDDFDYYVIDETDKNCDGLDNDCDGDPDDVFDPDPPHDRLCKCNPGDTAPCEDRTEGICVPGLFICIDGQLVIDGTCVQGETSDTCDNLDNDCDGTTDRTEAARLDCLNNIVGPQENARVDRCVQGDCFCVCDSGWWDNDHNKCTQGGGCEYPCYLSGGGVERCDVADNNCNGLIDAADQPLATVDALCPYRDGTRIPGRGGEPGGPAEACVSGVCQFECVSPPYADCNNDRRLPVPLPTETDASDGCEIDLTDNVDNCGACDNQCSFDHGGAYCQNFTCRLGACIGLWDNCNGQEADGCETSLETLSDCNGCGISCIRAHASAQCPNGNCRILSCDPGWGNCDGNDQNGCENPLDSLTDCGSCGTSCSRAHAGESCSGDSCHITTCESGWDNCDGADWNGCENSLDSLSDCGSCGTSCSRSHATASCSGDSCHIASCYSGWGNCDNNDQNGCENPLDSLSDCGSCGTSCSRSHASASCAGDSCHITSCDFGWGNCDNNDPNGCENTLDSLSDCGSCGTTCSRAHAGQSCSGDSCHITTCNSGWDNCDGLDSNGCENSLDSLSNCGSCGTPCGRAHATASCSGDTCHIASCDSGWGNCDNTDSNGCENPLDSLSDCGSCGTSCSRDHATASCSGDSCHISSCDSGWGNCDFTDSNGCETQLGTMSNCSTCGDNCNDGNLCTTDSCVSIVAGCSNTNNTIACNDGTYCNGADTCSGGSCSQHAGDPCPGPDGDGDCSETCNEGADNCSAADPNGSACSDGTYCNGTDTCSGGSCSQHTGDPCPGPDGDGNCVESCNEGADNCTANDTNGSACDDGTYCNGTDSCSSGSCSQHTGDPCPGPDGDGDCSETCNEGADNCSANDANGSACDDGQYCTGTDSCSSGSCSQHTGDPCPGPDGDGDCSESCNEGADNCTANDTNGSACDDGQYCTGTDSCSSGSCSQHTGDPCPGPDGDGDCSETCNEGANNCTAADTNGSACDDGQYCTGTDTCSGGSCSQHTGDPCPGPDGDGDCVESCNEGANDCTSNDPDESLCDGGTCQGGVCTP